MNVLIVYAHPEPSSFNAALRDASLAALRGAGHTVAQSDLYAMGFDPVSDRRNFRTVADASRLRLQGEEAHASRVGGFVPELEAEMSKLARCDLMLLHFPIWWLGPPAILKGWIDRVFAAGVAYGGGRQFGRGVMGGKRAMCVVTVGGLASDYGGAGHYAGIDTVLYPVQHGVLAFCGFEVLPPFVAWAPNRTDDRQRRSALRDWRTRLQALAGAPGAAQLLARTTTS